MGEACGCGATLGKIKLGGGWINGKRSRGGVGERGGEASLSDKRVQTSSCTDSSWPSSTAGIWNRFPRCAIAISRRFSFPPLGFHLCLPELTLF